MHIFKIVVLSLVIIAKTSIASDYGELDAYVPNNNIALADVMVLSTSKEVEDISLKFQEALKENPAWFQEALKENPAWFKEYLSKAEKGKALDFHKNFGISEKEYEYFLAESKNMQLVKTSEVTLKFSIATNGNVEISGLPAKQPHNKLTYDVKSNVIEIAKTILDTYSQINQTRSDSSTGRWIGKQWAYKHLESEGDFKSIKFAIGSKLDEQKHIIYYDVKIAVKGKPQKLTYILLYDAV
jgi:hypothetical protein